MNNNEIFVQGIFRPELLMGIINVVSTANVGIELTNAYKNSSSFYKGGRYGKGEVGEFVIIEGQNNIAFGRIIETKLISARNSSESEILGKVQLLGSISMTSLKVSVGIDAYPRIGDRVYSAPHQLIAMIPQLMSNDEASMIMLEIGCVDVAQECRVFVTPEKLFGRNLAILGSTGGGKSWSIANIIENCLKYNSKLILIDATGEYRNINGDYVQHIHLSSPMRIASNSLECSLPTTAFQESDFIALFEPSGKIQGPKLREAIKSLRLAKLCPDIFPDGYIKKIESSKNDYNNAINLNDNISLIDNPKTPFDVKLLALQLEHECVWPNAGYANNPDYKRWGKEDGNFSHCLSLVTRINGVLHSPAFKNIFVNTSSQSLVEIIDKFLLDETRLLRIDMSGISFEYRSREIIANVIGRYLLNKARSGAFINKPIIVLVDEAHNFLGKRIGSEDAIANLDAFELIAREGRKFGLNICLGTQRPRDITEGVLSQIGTMIVHRLTNDRDREIIERACGEIDRSASEFLPNLKPGEAIIIGNDFPIPLTVQIATPNNTPESTGANYQGSWKL